MGDVYGFSRATWRLNASRALAVSIGLSILFLIVYGGCNWITARRANVGTFLFWWEVAIPFVPFFILPYMSIDLFFVAAPFLCRTERELSIFTKRIATAILVAGVCFLIFPLRFAFPRPHADGSLGAIFDWFRGMDAPLQLAPVTPCGADVDSCGPIFSAYARNGPGFDHRLVHSDRAFARSHLPTSLGRHRRRICARGVLFLDLS